MIASCKQIHLQFTTRTVYLLCSVIMGYDVIFSCLTFCKCIYAELATMALQAKIDLYGPDSERLVDVLVLMAECYRALANYDEAEAFLNQVNRSFLHVFNVFLLKLMFLTLYRVIISLLNNFLNYDRL